MRSRGLTSEAERRKSFRRRIFVRLPRPPVVLVAAVLSIVLGGPREPLHADQILLKNGNRLEGRVSAAGPGRIRIELDAGSVIEIDLDQVAERIPGKAPIDLFAERLASLARDDRDGFVELARWGEERGVKRLAKDAWREVLRLDRHHATARSRLGYVLHRNRWVRRETLEDAGLTLFRGTWMTAEQIAELEAEERAAELDALLDDAGHDNAFVRENAMHRLLQVDDPALIPALERRLADEDPLRRMWAGRILANFPFGRWGEPLYRALLVERRTEVRSAWVAILRSSRDTRIPRWIARDLVACAPGGSSAPELGDEATKRHALLTLAATCPGPAVVPPLIEWIDDRAWGPPARRLLVEWFGERGEDAAAWRAWFAGAERGLSPDLGTGWLSKERERRD